MSLREVERWLPKVFLVYLSTKQSKGPFKKALENCTMESLTPYQSRKALYSVFNGFALNGFDRVT